MVCCFAPEFDYDNTQARSRARSVNIPRTLLAQDSFEIVNKHSTPAELESSMHYRQ
jgi:hypothetical protein